MNTAQTVLTGGNQTAQVQALTSTVPWIALAIVAFLVVTMFLKKKMMHLLDPNLFHLAALIGGALPLMGLSLLGLGGGGGGLGLSSSDASPISTTTTSGQSPVTVYNASSGPLSQSSWLVIGAIALVALLVIGMIFRR